ncbi:MAG: hypothetical protein JW741_01155, partial [Sedimentisphaerales bacterium]|nr:hypothetical protein [Sedimentisphaerales bacterium]
VLISSHNLDDVERFADHLGIINNGKLFLEGPTSDLVERFCMVDCTANNGAKPDSYPGIRVQERDGDRCRLLLDTAQITPETLADHGITDITTTPLTLEELFVALVKER